MVLLCAGCASTPSPDRARVHATSADQPASFPPDEEIRALLAEVVPDTRSHGIILGLLEPDGSRRVIAYGSTGPSGAPLNAGSVLEIGSLSKVFIGVLLADMIQRGEVELTEPIAGLLPPHVRVPTRSGREITLLDLATHTSGLPTMPGNFPEPENAEAYAGYTVDQMYEFLSSYELPKDPGGESQYSNLISLLGYGLARRAGKPYEVLLRERIFSPLGMEETAVTLTAEMERRMTEGSSGFGDPQPHFVAPAFAPSGGLKSTINDMLDFVEANLVEADTGLYAALRYARQPQRPIGDSGDFYGLGWGTDSLGHAVGHSGGTFGYNSYIYIDSEKRRALVALANFSGNRANEVGVHLLDQAEFPRPRPLVALEVAAVYRRTGVAEAISRYHTLRETASDRWRFDESQLNSVGYWLLRRGAVDDAIAIFRLNVEVHPAVPNLHDSLGDGYLAADRLQEAVESYRNATLLAEAAGDPNLAYFQANLKRAIEASGRPR